MHLPHSQTAEMGSPNQASEARTRLRGIWLALARLAWVAMASLALLLFLLGIPARYDHLHNLSGDDALGSGWAPAAIRTALAQLGLSVDFRATFILVTAVCVTVGSLAVAVVIVWRKSDDGLALFVSLFLLTLGIWPTGVTAALVVSHPEWSLPVQFVMAFSLISLLLFCCLFPNGRFVPRFTRVVAFVWSPLILCGAMIYPTPWGLMGQLLLLAGLGISVFAQVYRYRRVSGPVERQQTKWVVLGVTGLVLVFLLFVALLPVLIPALYQASALGVLWEMVGGGIVLFGVFLFVPLSVGIALLRYRLWDIDLVLSRTLVYGLLSVSVLALSALVVGVLGALFQTSGNGLITLLATGLVAALVFPVRTRLQRGVNQLLYGQRDEPLAVLSRLGQRLEATLAPDTVFPHLVETVAQALKIPYMAILLRDTGEFSVAAGFGQPTDDPLTLPVRYQGELIGQLQLAPRTPGEAFTPADLRLLDELARQAGIAAHAVELATELQRARERLVLAREEERRRLRRDLHDGIGPTLASLAQRLDTISRLVPHHPEAAITELSCVKAQVKTTIAEIRRLVYALRPPVLDELGLLSALREHIAQLQQPEGLHLTFEAPDALPELSAAVEVAAYRIVLEALTNVERHAHARECLVRLDLGDAGELCLSMSDDGTGLPANAHAGVGITSMRERAAELGGTCQMTVRSPHGTHVEVRLPVPKE